MYAIRSYYEMIPTHAYPELKKHPHFFGHFGTVITSYSIHYTKLYET